MDENLEALVSLAQAGDKQAFGQIYDQLIDEIYRFIYFKVHDQMLAQDITSECFKKLLINLRGYKRKNFKAYVYTVARNVFIDYTRDQKHYKSGIVMAELVDPQAQTKVEKIIEMESLNIALASLKKDFQEIITLRFIEGYSVKETAQLVKKTEVFVRVLQHRAIKELRTKLI